MPVSGSAAQELRPAPDYYLDAVVAFTAAESLAVACSEVSVDLQAVRVASGEILQQLEADGFDTSRPDAGIEDPSAVLNERLAALMNSHGLSSGADEDAVCAAARAEMSEGGLLAGYLVEVPE